MTATLRGITGPRSKIDAWCGATLKRSGSVYMLGAAGGHGDYAGNEVNALALNTATPGWVQLRPPTQDPFIINDVQFYLDNRPAATHTYYATQYIDSLDRMIVFPSPGLGGNWPPAPTGYPYGGSRRAFSFNSATGDWDDPDYAGQYPGTGDFTACVCAKHPGSGNVYYSRNYSDGFYRWTAATRTWAKISNLSRGPWYAGSAIDPRRNRMLIVGGYLGTAPPQIVDLAGNSVPATFSGLGADALKSGGYPGVVYDEVLDRYLVFDNRSSSIAVLAVDAGTLLVSQPSITGTAPLARFNGIHNSVQYVPELRGVVIANKYQGNVFFMRTSA